MPDALMCMWKILFMMDVIGFSLDGVVMLPEGKCVLARRNHPYLSLY